MKISRWISTLSLLVLTGCGGIDADYSAFAQCLSDRDITMYGAFWCPHCADQKELFGDAFEYVDYVECDPRGEEAQPELCLSKEIESYPTWIHPDGRRWEGTQTMETLSEISECPLPSAETTEASSETSATEIDSETPAE